MSLNHKVAHAERSASPAFQIPGLGGTRPRPPDNEELVVFTLVSEPNFRSGVARTGRSRFLRGSGKAILALHPYTEPQSDDVNPCTLMGYSDVPYHGSFLHRIRPLIC